MGKLVWKTHRAKRAEERAAWAERHEEWQIDCLLSGKRDRVLEETGIDLLAGSPFGPPLPKIPSADGGAGHDALNEPGAIDIRTPSQRLSDHIRDVLNDPERQAERRRLKAGGSHDAKDVPEDAPAAVSYPRVPWEM